MALKTDYPKPPDCFGIESTRTVQGIMFCLPSRRRFIPYSWLLHVECNRDETELLFNYTHAVVTVTGRNLAYVHEAIIRFYLYTLRETPPSALARSTETTITRIEIPETAAN
jgi:hypothetical protein